MRKLGASLRSPHEQLESISMCSGNMRCISCTVPHCACPVRVLAVPPAGWTDGTLGMASSGTRIAATRQLLMPPHCAPHPSPSLPSAGLAQVMWPRAQQAGGAQGGSSAAHQGGLRCTVSLACALLSSGQEGPGAQLCASGQGGPSRHLTHPSIPSPRLPPPLPYTGTRGGASLALPAPMPFELSPHTTSDLSFSIPVQGRGAGHLDCGPHRCPPG